MQISSMRSSGHAQSYAQALHSLQHVIQGLSSSGLGLRYSPQWIGYALSAMICSQMMCFQNAMHLIVIAAVVVLSLSSLAMISIAAPQGGASGSWEMGLGCTHCNGSRPHRDGLPAQGSLRALREVKHILSCGLQCSAGTAPIQGKAGIRLRKRCLSLLSGFTAERMDESRIIYPLIMLNRRKQSRPLPSMPSGQWLLHQLL